MMAATGCTATEAPSPEPVCRVDGDTKLLPTMTKVEICARFMAALDAGLPQPAAPVASRSGWQFRLSVTPPGVATALLSHRDLAHVIDVNIAVSDRALDGYAIDSLGTAAAQRILAES